MQDRVSKLNLITGFAAIYLIWGSTYLAIRFAVETLPPLMMASVRFFGGAAIFFVWANFRKAPSITGRQFGWAFFTGVLMLGIGGGAVHWAEQYVPSGLAALLVTSVPLMIVGLDWLRPGGVRPSPIVMIGLVMGLTGIFLLVKPQADIIDQSGYLAGAIVILIGAIAWSLGTLISRHADLPKSQLLATAIKLFAGGSMLAVASLIADESVLLSLDAVTMRSILSLVYLITFGSLAFAAYNWLLKASTPAKVSTYAYVNPVVAVILGTVLAGESLSTLTVVAMVVITAAVFVIVNDKAKDSIRLTPDSETERGSERLVASDETGGRAA